MTSAIVYLVGFMGAGKTAVGRRLAVLLGRSFLDLDEEVEKRAGVSIPEIFREKGETHFRALESEELRRVSKKANLVVAVGGGGFCSEENQEIIAGSGTSVWLEAPLSLLFARCRVDASARPLFSSLAEMEPLLDGRRPFYARAALRVQVDDLGIEALAARIQKDLADLASLPSAPKNL